MCAQTEFVFWIERILLSRGRGRRGQGREVRHRMLSLAEKGIEQMYIWRDTSVCIAGPDDTDALDVQPVAGLSGCGDDRELGVHVLGDGAVGAS